MSATIQLIVGLGNPGPQYEDTRHNVGAWLTEQLATQANAPLRVESKFFGNVAKVQVDGQICWLLCPTTYMNDSGRSVAAFTQYYKIPPDAILVAHDELDFPVGTIRIKQGGGHGGHNGLRDLISALGSKDFFRLRIGIGHPGHKEIVSPYVLSAPSRSDREKILQSLGEAHRALPALVNGDIEKAFRQLHSKR